MKFIAGCALAVAVACLACGSSRSGETPVSGASVSDPQAADPPAVEPEPAVAKTPTIDLADMPWPADPRPAVKAVFAGSWEPREPLGFDQTWFDEAALLALPANQLAGRRKWRGMTSAGERMLVDAQIRDRDGPAIAYSWWLLTWDEIVGPPKMDVPAVIHFRHCGRVRLWFDGELLIDEQPTPDGTWRTFRRAVTLTGSDDVFLVKSARGSPELGPTADFELLVSTPDGGALPGQIWQTVRVW